MDMHTVIVGEYRGVNQLESYTLEAVVGKFLKEKREELPWRELCDLFHGSAHMRTRIACHCLQVSVVVFSKN